MCDGLVLAIEAAEGTDAMITRVADFPSLRGTPRKRRGVLVKALEADPGPKDGLPGDRRRDGAERAIVGLCRHRH